MSIKHSIAFFVCTFCACALAAGGPNDFRSPLAKRAHQEYERDLAAAKAAHDRVVAVAANKYVLALTRAKDVAAKQGDLNDALTIRKELVALEAGPAGGSANLLRKRLVGSRWQVSTTTIVFKDQNTVFHTKEKQTGRWTVVSDNAVLIEWPDHHSFVVVNGPRLTWWLIERQRGRALQGKRLK